MASPYSTKQAIGFVAQKSKNTIQHSKSYSVAIHNKEIIQNYLNSKAFKAYHNYKQNQDKQVKHSQAYSQVRETKLENDLNQLNGVQGYYLDAAAARVRSMGLPKTIDTAAIGWQALGGLKKYAGVLLLPSFGLPAALVGTLAGKKMYEWVGKIESRYQFYNYLLNYYSERLPAHYASAQVRKVGIAGLRGGLETVGNALGLNHYVFEYNPYAPFRQLSRPWKNINREQQKILDRTHPPHIVNQHFDRAKAFSTFKPSWWLRQRYAKIWQNIAGTGEFGLPSIKWKGKTILKLNKTLAKDSHIRHTAAKLAKKKRQSGSILPWMFFIDLFGGLLGGALASFLESKVWGIGIIKFIRGYARHMLRAIPSASAFSGAYLGQQLGKSFPILNTTIIKTPIHFSGKQLTVNLGGVIGGGFGWHYQTALNMARDYQVVPKGYFMPNSGLYNLPSAKLFRINNIANYELASQTEKIHLTQEYYRKNVKLVPETTPRMLQPNGLNPKNWTIREAPEYINCKAWNTKYLSNNKILKLFNKPAQWMRNPFVRLPLRGVAINSFLGIPMSSPIWWVITGLDYGSQVVKDLPLFKTFKKSTVFGGVVGAQIASLYGLPIVQSIAAGALLGAGFDLLKTVANYLKAEAVAPGVYHYPHLQHWLVKPFKRMFKIPYIGQKTYQYWKFKMPFIGLKYAELAIPSFAPRAASSIQSFMDRFPYSSHKAKNFFRYLHSAGTGAGIGITASWILQIFNINAWWANPIFLGAAGATAGLITKFITNKFGVGSLTKITGTWLSEGWTLASRTVGRILGGIFSFTFGSEAANLGFDIFSAAKGEASLKLGPTLGKSVLVVLGILSAIQAGPIGWVLFAAGAVAEVIAQLAYHRSLIDIIWTKFSYAMAKAGKALPTIAGQIMGFFFGVFKAMTAKNVNELVTGAVTAAAALGIMGTATVVIFVISSSLFYPLQKSTFLAFEFSTIQKKATLLNPNKLQYQYTFHYDQELDAAGNPVTGGKIGGALTNVKIKDSFDNLKYSDLVSDCNVQFSFSGQDVWDYKCRIEDDSIILESGDKIEKIPPNTTFDTIINLNLNRPLENILGNNILCNNYSVQADFPSLRQGGFKTQTKLCIDSQGNRVRPPAAEFARILVEATRYAFCSNPNYLDCNINSVLDRSSSQLMEMQKQFMEHMEKGSIDAATAQRVWKHVYQSALYQGCFQCVGFVYAHQEGIGYNFGMPSDPNLRYYDDADCAKYYINYPPSSYEWHNKSETKAIDGPLQEGDIAVFGDGYAGGSCGHIAIVTSTDFSLGGNTFWLAEAQGGNPNTCTGIVLNHEDKPITTDNPYYQGFLRHQ